MKKNILTLTLLLSTLLLANCASIVSGSQQEITIDSYPQGGQIFLNGAMIGVTPAVTKIKRGMINAHIEIRKEGYETGTIVLMEKVNPWFWGNIITGGLLGSSTDSSTGANKAYEPGQYFLQLTAIPVAPAPAPVAPAESTEPAEPAAL